MTTTEVHSKPCVCDDDGCVSLLQILEAFNAPITEEHAWAVCYQCAKTCQTALDDDREKCVLVSELEHVMFHRDGFVHRKTIVPVNGSQGRSPLTSETKLIFQLGSIIWRGLDFGLSDYEEKNLSPELENLIDVMTVSDDHHNSTHHETDDEGIERDAGDDDPAIQTASLDVVIRLCVDRLGKRTGLQADAHYRAVVRALVTEALELSSFLEKVSEGTNDLKTKTESTSAELDKLQFSDWARLWIQVIRELRNGVKLKKVDYSRTPIEFELTPYEILMDDIRSRRYKLNKVMVDGDIPHRVKKDAHAIILEFIRSRPPLKKASDRKLRPAVSRPSTPRELLMDSIKKGRALRPSLSPYKSKKVIPVEEPVKVQNSEQNPTQTRRLIQVDFSILQSDDEDDDLPKQSATNNKSENGSYIRTGTATISQEVYEEYVDQALEPYDLATRCPSRRPAARRHTITLCDKDRQALSVPQSRPDSRQSNISAATEEEIQRLGKTPPEMSCSRTSLQDDIFHTKTWTEECLSLTLEEIVHIRSVLTKAELEALPVDGHVKEDVEKRRVCFLCLKTRFSIFGSWGQKCRLCKRTICAKCYSKMRIPTEHFSHVPVVALSPSLLNSPQEEDDSLTQRLSISTSSPVKSLGSAPSSPQLTRSAPGSRLGHHTNGGLSLPPSSPASTASERRSRLSRSRTMGRPDKKSESLKGIEMIVCHDCKAMVIQIIKSSRTSRNNAIRNLTLNLSSVY